MKKSIVLVFIGLHSIYSLGQQSVFLKPSDTLNTNRRNAVVITEAVLGTASLIALDQLWYSDFERSTFKTVNDNGDWYGMDKMGHVFSSYQLGRYGYDLLAWSGVGERDRLLYGATLGFTFLLAVEMMDAYSEEWGFSWADVASNGLGTGLFIGQQLLWKEQRVSLKFSFQSSEFASINPNQLGESFSERLFKDYNGQTYWLSFNLKSFFKNDFFPPWFNVALGYGADGMLNGSFNDPELPVQDPFRQYFFSLDIDLTKIKTKSQFLQTVFSVFNFIKIPAPALEIRSSGTMKLHLLYF